LIGFVVTSRVTHATPASFTSHAVDRDLEQFIAYQQVNGSFDLMFGGGLDEFVNRQDNVDLIAVAKEKGYNFVQNLTGNTSRDRITDRFLSIFEDYY
jgi:alkaline phosphatase